MHNHHHHHHHHHTHPRPSISPHEPNSPNSRELALRNPVPVLLPENPVSLPVATGQKRTLIQSWCSSLTATKVIQSHLTNRSLWGKSTALTIGTMVKWPEFWRYPKRSKESHGTCISAVCISAARCSSWRIPSSTCEIQKWPELSLNVSKYLVNIIKYLVIDITKWFSSVPFKGGSFE